MDDLYNEIRRVRGKRAAPFLFEALDEDGNLLTTLTWKGVEGLIAQAHWSVVLEWTDVDPPGNLAVFGAADTLKLSITIEGVEQTHYDSKMLGRVLEPTRKPAYRGVETLTGPTTEPKRNITEAVELRVPPEAKRKRAGVGPIFGQPKMGMRGDGVVSTITDFRKKLFGDG